MSEKPKNLKERLQLKHEKNFSTFRETILQLNNEADESQLEKIKVLKSALAKSHDEARAILEEEKRLESNHLSVLEAHEELCKNSESPSAVLTELVDVFHKEKDTTVEQNAYRMEQERFRVLHVAVKLRNLFHHRMELVEACGKTLEAAEENRRENIQELLRKLMLDFAKISYIGVTNSHVMAQQVIHNVNEQLVENFLGIKGLLAQLSQREVYLQRQYSGQIADIYKVLLQRLSRSQVDWAYSRLRSVLFRRPAFRMTIVERVMGLSGTVQRDVKTFLSSIGVVVCSLRNGAPGPQQCGGSTPAGWLRHYDPDLTHPVFAGSEEEVVQEWVMKANVMIRNSLTNCLALAEQTRVKEVEMLREVAALKSALLHSIESINTPLKQEVELWQESSLTTSDIDDCYRLFLTKNMTDISQQQVEAENKIVPVTEEIELEGEWFANTVRDGLQHSHTFFEDALVLRVQSIMRLFDCSSTELTNVATGVLGFVRHFYRRRIEADKDSADAIAKLEEHFLITSRRLGHAGSVTSSEELFTEGLHYLDKIAKAYTKHHKNTLSALTNIMKESQEEYDKYAIALQKKIGLEEKSDTERRLALERQEKIQTMFQQLVQEQNALQSRSGKKDSKNSTDSNKSEPVSITLSMVEESVPVEEPDYPQYVAADGTVYNVISELLLDAPPAVPADPVAKSNAKRKSSTSITELKRSNSKKKMKEDTTEAPPPKMSASDSFQQVYLPLLADTVKGEENFVTTRELEEWVVMLRVEVAQWLRKLKVDSQNELKQYCEKTKEEADKTTNEILREHRRRPARFQADCFESRVRELENTSNTFEKHCARLLERASKVNAMWSGLHSNQSWKAEDERIIRELNTLKESASEANTAASLQVQERRFAALTNQFMNNFERRCKELKESIKKQKDSLEAECRVYLDDRAKQLSEGVHTDNADANAILDADPLTIRVRQILQRLEESVEVIQQQSAKEEEERQAVVDLHRSEYEVIYKQNNAELILLSTVQECLARIKAQVQSAILSSNTSEEKLNEIITKLEQAILKPVSQVSLAKTIKVRLQRDYALETSSKPAVKELTPEMIQEEEDQLEEKLTAEKTQLQRLVKSGDTSNILAIIDTLREHLYVRAGALNALLNSVEMIQVSPEYYVEPKPLPKEAREVGPTSAKGKKNTKTTSRAAVLIYDPLPPTTSIEAAFRKWADEIHGEVKSVAQSHLATYPPPLNRRLQGMQGGNLADLLSLTETLCEQQEKRIKDHTADGLRRFHQQVQRVNIAMQSVPQYVTATVHALTVSAVEKRVGCVLESFGELHSYSSALKTLHQSELKVSLGQQVHRNKLEELAEIERVRQQLSKKFIEQYWGYILREVQDESGLHSVRCACTVNTFFNLLKGIVTPFHLIPVEGSLAVGQHRGLKHLMRMRDRERQLKEIEVVTERQEHHLQETMPLMKQETNRKVSKSAGGADGPILIAVKEVEYDGLPLNELRPLEEFNTDHTDVAVTPLPSAHVYYAFPGTPSVPAPPPPPHHPPEKGKIVI
ncbi:hypothetical protein AGDE_07700 [Angomonas deanei]|uniref:DUF4456 domain-containing protein n=1 Tax=Angomonas deanei TaxID=59799 RepID=A0A7G2C7Y5_9TRYP|nr:hypothetical protein AGDE_07700 [Angomonas deanei]CAD2215141.1 Domain of unknown function (DUF4455)/Domain of unknown function (DUF4456), putative [Angomonas deanei]|eukprot:EPY34936.1 hypothetical protein AGDE_07700 [Angomonas deanei]